MTASSKRVWKSVHPHPIVDFSGGVQSAVSRLLHRRNELDSAKNAVFNKKIGAVARRDGYEQVGFTIQPNNESLGLHVYRYNQNNKIIVGINNQGGTNATLQFLDTGGYWNTILSDAAPSTRFEMLDFLEECYVAGYARDTNTYLTLRNIGPDLVPSTSRNVANAPKARFIDEYGGSLYAMNVEIGGRKYKDRIYKSSPPLGAVTFVQTDQKGLLQQLHVDSVRYLKAGMTVDIYSAGTEAKVVDSLTIVSVDKSRDLITFGATSVNVKDNDELWLSGRKNLLSILWNTDYPTPETSDWLRIPSGVDSNPTITAHGKNNNRKLFFTTNSTWKWDGANLINVSETIGCVASETVKNVGAWTLWLHTTGVWGYNDSTGQLRLLSRSMQDYIRAINLATVHLSSAVVNGRIYKLSVGQPADLDASTTSTSTSSTSTSSTSSSTSSTSTSSTSTSSTTTSTSTTTGTTTSTSSTSTSSTSSSTSSTSASTSSTSKSTSTSSTSMSTSSTMTTTLPSTKNVMRMVYDFDSNIWWTEFHKREFRYQIMHTMSGYSKPYFTDETGRLFRDETGNLDNQDSIPFEIIIGRDNFGTPLQKAYTGCVVQSEKSKAMLVQVSIDGRSWQDMGQVTEDNQVFKFPASFRGHDINYRLTYNNQGDGPIVDGIVTYFSMEESSIG